LIQKSQVSVCRESSNFVEFENKCYSRLSFVVKFKATAKKLKKNLFIFLRKPISAHLPALACFIILFSFLGYQPMPGRLPP
jgi:hypothetical protein